VRYDDVRVSRVDHFLPLRGSSDVLAARSFVCVPPPGAGEQSSGNDEE
jgi:hypothetical protein